MRLLIAGGGTGGHIFPAISIAEEMEARDKESKILFVGTKEGMEREMVTKRGYEIKFISSTGIVGKGKFALFVGGVFALKGLLDSIRIIRGFAPDFALGVGGYVSGPVVLAAWILGIPTAICEQNSIPGVTNRILGRLVRKIFATFESSRNYFPDNKTMITGNPIRKDILHGKTGTRQNEQSDQRKDSFTVLVIGGSQGARRLNLSVPEALGIMENQDVKVIHQTGKGDAPNVKKHYNKYEISAEVTDFIEDMGSAYRRADIVIGRAGAGTIAEITALGVPSVLIPYPHSTHDHQLMNAKALEEAGASLVVEDGDAEPEKIALVLSKFMKKDTLHDMGKRAGELGKPDAAERIVDEIYRLAHSSSS